jgi:hypothetical protein
MEKGKPMARCKFCNQEITWMKENGRNKPINGDGGIHLCDEMKNSMKSIKSVPAAELDPEILKQYESAINLKVVKK